MDGRRPGTHTVLTVGGLGLSEVRILTEEEFHIIPKSLSTCPVEIRYIAVDR
jgi:hypothetical protein